MSFRILAVGDIVGEGGLEFLSRNLRRVKIWEKIDFTIVNGENASGIGITGAQAQDILDAGADVITLGNHTFSKQNICNMLEDSEYILRPANFAPQVPGRGFGEYDTRFGKICVINLIGRCSMAYGPDNPFIEVKKILKCTDAKFKMIDFHAEATSEKLALCYMLDGSVTGIFGTHTHVQTSDGDVFPNGTGYITDVGMTGPIRSVIGVKPEISVSGFMGNPPIKYAAADGDCKMECAVFEADEKTGLCTSVRALRIL